MSSEEQALLVIDKPHMTVRVYRRMLKIDVKGSFRNELEEALENTPVLKQTRQYSCDFRSSSREFERD